MANRKYNSVVAGDINGHFTEFFAKLAGHHVKQNFAFGIIAGNLFSDQDATSHSGQTELDNLLRGNIEIPFPIYFSLGHRQLPPSVIERLESNEGELCPNLSILGRRVSIKTSEGFRIVAVGGSYDAAQNDDPMDMYQQKYSDNDIETLSKDPGEVDILITSDWPAAVSNGSKAVYKYEPPRGVMSMAKLCTNLKPRYHFSASEGYYEREPFFQHTPPPRPVTRFLSLAPFGNTAKDKWLYAFSLEPSAPSPASLPEGCTAPPFATQKKRKLESQQENYNNFRYANGNGNSYDRDRGHRNKKQRNQPPPTPDQCFFCLSNKAFEAHMVGSIGDEAYVTVAKGPLSTRKTFGLSIPGHMLIIPLQHSPMISVMPDDVKESTQAEMQRYKEALQQMITAKSTDEDGKSTLGAVTWEISRSGGIHVHWQFLPIPIEMIERDLVELAFDVQAQDYSYPKFVKGEKEMAEVEKGDYLKVMIWCEDPKKCKNIVLPLDKSFRFDLQFVRKVLAKLLGLEDRTDWRACSQAQAEEEADATAFKEAFKQFDFSLA